MAKRREFLLSVACALLSSGALSAQTSENRFVIVLIGPTGSGKTTQAEFLKRTFGIPTIAVDDLIAENPAALEKYRTAGIDPGMPQESPALDQLVRDRLSKVDLNHGAALDGYPATKDQADHLAALVKDLGLPSPIVIQIDVPDNVVRKRLRKRKRQDDKPELIERRLKDYHRELEMIRAYYPEANIWTIDGTRPATYVSKTIESILKDEIPRKR